MSDTPRTDAALVELARRNLGNDYNFGWMQGYAGGLERELAEANICEQQNFERAEHNLRMLEDATRENAALREVETMRDQEIAWVREKHGDALLENDALRAALMAVEPYLSDLLPHVAERVRAVCPPHAGGKSE